jgi:hypothetical protein
MHETPDELKAREKAEAKALVEERRQQAIDREQSWRVACINKQTFATQGGRAYRFTNRDGSSYCLNPVTARNITLGDPFSVGNSYRHDVIVHDAGGYDRECLEDAHHAMRINGDGNCRIDVTVPRKNQYWLELPEGLPKGVQMPALPKSVQAPT